MLFRPNVRQTQAQSYYRLLSPIQVKEGRADGDVADLQLKEFMSVSQQACAQPTVTTEASGTYHTVAVPGYFDGFEIRNGLLH